MPGTTLIARSLAAVGLVLASLTLVSVAEAKTYPTELTIVDDNGALLVDQTQYVSTKDSKLKSDPKADCFGPGTGGSGKKVTVPGASALGQAVDASHTTRAARKISVSDNFDFGLAICGIGKAVATQKGFLYLKRNHVASQTGGDLTPVEKNDEILWYVVEDFTDPPPVELEIKAPARAEQGGEFGVKVTAYADDGTKTAAKGIKIEGAQKPTDADGRTTVSVNDAVQVGELLLLVAADDGAIPATTLVCVQSRLQECPAGYARRINGTTQADRIATGRQAEYVSAGAGDDEIVGKSTSAPDFVDCGPGEDRVSGYGRGLDTKGCEKVSGAGKGK
jgi:hypothetical protein